MGATTISPIPNNFTSNDCFNACLNNTGITGCEYHKHGGCAYHTSPISGGSADGDYTCWVMNNGKDVDDGEIFTSNYK